MEEEDTNKGWACVTLPSSGKTGVWTLPFSSWSFFITSGMAGSSPSMEARSVLLLPPHEPAQCLLHRQEHQLLQPTLPLGIPENFPAGLPLAASQILTLSLQQTRQCLQHEVQLYPHCFLDHLDHYLLKLKLQQRMKSKTPKMRVPQRASQYFH
ncbi:hypothetical protein E2C01_020636 [Portunus trituberculatus]|uniref:Uncharacterized protein n=1 Tax=Portunus trituberculatus TaxID=210409 RepID=A0A5B7E2V5_PORTR|nr:hypothetical protein [Portunus trituberculatus]